MNVFDMIGPVMIGPSSSHTAGAVRIGKIGRQLFGGQPAKALITLHGSFAQTGRGHGTDKAIVAGLLNLSLDDGRIRQSLKLAEESGLNVSFKNGHIKNAHPNTAMLELSGGGKSLSLIASSVGGGNIAVKKIDDFDVEFTGQYNTLVIRQLDTPGVVASVTSILAQNRTNIASMRLYRSCQGGEAIMIIETDQEINAALQEDIANLKNIRQTIMVKPV